MDQIRIERGIRLALHESKYALISADEFTIAPELVPDRRDLWTDWERLEPDNHLQDGSHFRLRRFGLFYLLPSTGQLLPLPPAPYFQSAGTNLYAGGIKRRFAPLLDATLANPFLHELIKFNFRQFPVHTEIAHQPWEIDVHQFRIIATQDEQGEPTPEGIHHDEDDFNAIHLIRRHNTSGGINTVYDNDRNPLASTTLDQPLDSVLVWDPYVMHSVSPICPKNPTGAAIRDVLVIGYNHRPNLKQPS